MIIHDIALYGRPWIVFCDIAQYCSKSQKIGGTLRGHCHNNRDHLVGQLTRMGWDRNGWYPGGFRHRAPYGKRSPEKTYRKGSWCARRVRVDLAHCVNHTLNTNNCVNSHSEHKQTYQSHSKHKLCQSQSKDKKTLKKTTHTFLKILVCFTKGNFLRDIHET